MTAMEVLRESSPLFGSFVKKFRDEQEIGLREFCLKLELDPGNWSKIERGIFQPPNKPELLKRIAKMLGLNEAERQNLSDYADLDKSIIPKDIAEDKYVLKMLPAFMRTVSETKPTEGEMDALLQLIREDYVQRIKKFNDD